MRPEWAFLIAGLLGGFLICWPISEWMRARERAFWKAALEDEKKRQNSLLNRVQSWSPEQFVSAEAQQKLIERVGEKRPEPKEPETLEEKVKSHPAWAHLNHHWAKDGLSLTVVHPQTRKGVTHDRQFIKQAMLWEGS